VFNRMPTVTSGPFKQEYEREKGPQYRGNSFWRFRIPGRYRPINLSREQQMNVLGIHEAKIAHKYSDLLNHWYGRCMEVDGGRRVTAAELVADMVPVAENEIARLEQEREENQV
jgi:hypothetical protein